MKLNLTFTEDARDEHVKLAMKRARAAGASHVAPLFPDAPLPELARFYSLDADDAEIARAIVKALRDLRGVQAIEAGPKRRLIKANA